MSAARQKPGGVVIPLHVITFEGRRINNDVAESETADLQRSAKVHGFDLESHCQSLYGYGSNWLSREQQNATLRALIDFKTAPLAGKEHRHPCNTCHTSTVCYREVCKEMGEDECYSCRERLTAFYRKGDW